MPRAPHSDLSIAKPVRGRIFSIIQISFCSVQRAPFVGSRKQNTKKVKFGWKKKKISLNFVRKLKQFSLIVNNSCNVQSFSKSRECTYSFLWNSLLIFETFSTTETFFIAVIFDRCCSFFGSAQIVFAPSFFIKFNFLFSQQMIVHHSKSDK